MADGSPVRAQKGALPMSFGFVRADEGVWRKSARSALEFRDVGLHGSTKGLLDAQHIRATAAGNREGWFSSDLDLTYVHVLTGSLKLKTRTGETIVLAPGDSVISPPFDFDPSVFQFSSDFEGLEFTSAGAFAPIEKFMVRTGQTPGPFGSTLGVARDKPELYIIGDGPRSFFSYRDLGATAATGGRMHIHVVGIAAQPPGGTGWHTHSMDQFFMPFTGEIEISVEGLGKVLMHKGDAMYIPAGIRHNVTGFTLDYTVVEVCIPSVYDTNDAVEPT